jgi:SAM-dependent methyltransferase
MPAGGGRLIDRWTGRSKRRFLVNRRVDFSDNAAIYDRRHGTALSHGEAERLCAAAQLHQSARVLDIGAGTGRVAIPMAACGCDVVALEPSAGMVKELRAKDPSATVSIIVGEGARLPFPAASFEAVVIARLLYLTPDWQQILAECRRVLLPAGRLLHEWGNGESDEAWVRVREEARRLFESAGVARPFHPGVRSEAVVEQRLEQLGFDNAAGVSMSSGETTTLGEFLRRLAEGELSYIWALPPSVRAECLPRLMRWAGQTFDLQEPMAMPRAVRWSLYRRDAT